MASAELSLSGAPPRQSTAGERATKRRSSTRAGAPTQEDTAPWTASRCLRILRRLESRLALLRKLVHTPIDVQRAQNATITEPTAKRRNLPGDHEEEYERRKRPRNTYGGRSKKRKISTESPASVSPTRQTRPLRAMKSRYCSMQAEQRTLNASVCATNQGNAPSAVRLPSLDPDPKAIHEDRTRLHQEIVDWLQDMLLCTQTTTREPHRKSLLGMCLRKVPACIDEIEAWDKAMAQDEAPNSIRQTPDAALDIYSQLEAFGAAGLGWRPLKHTLRAHGLWMLKKAIEQNVFSPSETVGLLHGCFKWGHVDEATQLIMKPKGQYPFPRSEGSFVGEEPSLRSLGTLLVTVRVVRGMALEPVFDLVWGLIKQKQLPAAWLSTQDFSHLLAAATEVIGTNEGSTAAFGFIAEAISALCATSEQPGYWHNAEIGLRTLCKMAAALVALGGSGTCKGDKIAETRASFALDACMDHIRAQQGLDSEEALFVLELARYLVGDGSVSYGWQHAHEPILGLEAADIDHHGASPLTVHHYHKIMDFVCFIAEACSRRSHGPAHETLIAMLLKIERLPWPRWVSKCLRKEGAFVLAQRTQDLRDLAFAESRQACKVGSSPSERSDTIFSDWYWDDTIGEFVKRSPQKERGGSPTTRLPRSQSQTRHSPCHSPQLSGIGAEIDHEAAQAVGVADGSDDGLDDPRIKNGIAEEKESMEPVSQRERKTSIRSETIEEGATQGTIRGRQWEPATEQGYPMSKRMFSTGGIGRNRSTRLERLGSEPDASPAPIGGARQLFIFRGPGRRNVGEEADWLDW